MRVYNDDIKVQFRYRGTPNFRLPVAVRPRSAVRGFWVVSGLIFLWGAALSGPAMWVQPGPGGVVLTAVLALLMGGVTGYWVMQTLTRWDGVERPMRYTAASFRAEVMGERPEPVTVECSSSAGVFPVFVTKSVVSNSHLVGVDCVRKNCWCAE